MRVDITSQSTSTFANLFTNVLTMAVNFAVNFFLSPFIVRSMGEAANGFTQLAANFVTYASLVSAAFNSMAKRHISVCYHGGDHGKMNTYYSSVVACNIVIAAFFIPVFTYVILRLDSLISIGDSEPSDVRVLFSCVFFSYILELFLSAYSSFLFVLNKIYIQNTINMARAVLNAMLLLCLFSVLPPKMYYISLCSVCLTVAGIPIYRRLKKKLLPELRFLRRLVKWKAVLELLRSGIWNTVNQGGEMLMTGLDLLLTNLFIDAKTMGLLAIAKMAPTAIISLGTAVNTSFAPALTMDWAREDSRTIMAQLRRSMKISSIMLSVPGAVFCGFSVAFYTLWQPTLDSQKLAVLSILSFLAYIPCSGTQALYNVFTAANRLKWNSVTFLITGCLNVVIVYLLLRFTAVGVYAVAGVGPILLVIRELTLTFPYITRLLGQKWNVFYKDAAYSLLCFGVNFCVARLVGHLFDEGVWVSLIFAIALSCVISLLLDMFLLLTKEERSALVNKLLTTVNR